MSEIPKVNVLNTPKELADSGIEIVSNGSFEFQNKKFSWMKISMHKVTLDVPIFMSNGSNVSNVEKIKEFLLNMTTKSCRDKLGGLYESCSVDLNHERKGKSIGIDDKKIVTADIFSKFVGINIVGGDPEYEALRKILHTKNIYPNNKTMIEDFTNWWNDLPTQQLVQQNKLTKYNSEIARK